MNRTDFLEKTWAAYPEGKLGWTDVAEFIEKGKPAKTVVAGRLIVAQQTDFAHVVYTLNSGGGEIVLAFKTTLEWMEPQASRSLELKQTEPLSLDLFEDGDLIAVEGANEISGTFEVSKILLLVPSSRSVELPFSEFTVPRAKLWSDYLSEVRAHFVSKGFLESTTPTLVPSPGTEPFLDPFKTQWEMGSEKRDFYLPTSPEFHLKQLLVRGFTKLFEIKPCFRNGEVGSHHQPEFLMLEWYRAYSNLEAIALDVESLLETLASKFQLNVPKLRRCTMPQLFAVAYPGFELKPETTREELAAVAEKTAIAVSADDSFDDLFFRLFLEKIEPNLGADGPLLVSHYPPSQAALSRIGDHGFAERFEIYWKGLELANAFHELNRVEENEARFADDATKKKALNKPSVPRDENLVRALRYGMPPSGGIALGVDRLFMAMFGIEKIQDARAFPITLHPY